MSGPAAAIAAAARCYLTSSYCELSEVTTRVAGAVLVRLPLTPLIVSPKVPAAVLALVVTVSVDAVPERHLDGDAGDGPRPVPSGGRLAHAAGCALARHVAGSSGATSPAAASCSSPECNTFLRRHYEPDAHQRANPASLASS